VLGPCRQAISGVSTHVNLLLDSPLGARFQLEHFQVGAEGRGEGPLGRLARLAASPLALAAAILRRRAAVVHVNTSLNARAFWRDVVYVLVARLCGARVLFQVHGGALREFSAGWRPVLRPLLALPDLAVVLSRVEQAAWREIVPRQHVAAVPNGVGRPDAVRARALRGALLRLVYVGRLAPGKGLEESLEAVAVAHDAGVELRFSIAGAGPEEPRLRSQVRRLGLERQVSFCGPVAGERKAALLGEADVLLLASHSEGLPYALLEAMAAGVVPIVTPCGGMPDVVVPGLHGLFVPPGDAGALARAIESLARDRKRLARMGAACRERIAACYSIERVADDFAALYGKLDTRWAPSQAG
jgi:glycosyltransferase involved in cell wall biosynthesis